MIIRLANFKVSIPADQIKRLESLLDPKQVKQALFQAVRRTADEIRTIEVDSIVEHSELTRHAAHNAVMTIIPRGDIPEGRVVVSGKGVPIIGFRPTFLEDSGMSVTAGGELHVMPHVFKATMKGTTNDDNEYSHVGAFYRMRAGDEAPPAKSFSIAAQLMQKSGRLKMQGAEPLDSIMAKNARRGRMANQDRGKVANKDRARGPNLRADPWKPGGVKAGFAERLPIHEVFGPSAASFADKREIESQVKERLGEMMEKNLDSQIDRFLKEAK